MQIQQGVHLNGGLVLAELGPREQCQTQIDGCGIQRVEAVRQIYTKWIVDVERPRDTDQGMREVGVDAPVVGVIGVGQRGARHAAVEAHGRACHPKNASRLLCRADHPGKSVERRPSIDTGPNTRSPAASHHRRSAPHTGETHDPAGSPAIEKTRFGPGSRTIVVHLRTGFRSQLPFKSRQVQNRRNHQQEKELSTGWISLAGH